MNKTIIYISPDHTSIFEATCTKQRIGFELMSMTDNNAIYEVSFSLLSDLFYLGIYYGMDTLKKVRNEAHTH